MNEREALEYMDKLHAKAMALAVFLNNTREVGWTKDDDIKAICYLIAMAYTNDQFDFEVFDTIKQIMIQLSHVIIKADENQ